MANATEHSVHAVHGTDPQSLIAAIVRQHVYASPYWKEQCFGLNAATMLDRAVQLDHCGITHSEHLVPTRFLCLLLKMLQIQPDARIIAELLQQAEYKYVRLLAALYWRLVGRGEDVYRQLEPLLADYRRVRVRKEDGGWELQTVDELVDCMLQHDKWRGLSLPRIMKRQQLVQLGRLEQRRSLLDDVDNKAATPLEQQPDVQPQLRLPSPRPQQPAVSEQEAKQQPTPIASHGESKTVEALQSAAPSSGVQEEKTAVQADTVMATEQKVEPAAVDGSSNGRQTAEAALRDRERRDERSDEKRRRREDDDHDRRWRSSQSERERESDRHRDSRREEGREKRRDRGDSRRHRTHDYSSSDSSSRSRSAERSRHRSGRESERPRDRLEDGARRHRSSRDERSSGRSARETERRRPRRSRSSSRSRSRSSSLSSPPRRRRRSRS